MSDLIDRQKAIEALQKEIDKGKPPFNDTIGAVRCGVRLARNIIEDLPSAQPVAKDINVPCTDTISRQAAIDGTKKIPDLTVYSYCSFLDMLSKLPSAEPEIIRCKDCKWFDDIGCAIRIVDDTDKPSEEDYCSFAERKIDE